MTTIDTPESLHPCPVHRERRRDETAGGTTRLTSGFVACATLALSIAAPWTARAAEPIASYRSETAWIEADIVAAIQAMPGAAKVIRAEALPLHRVGGQQVWDPDGYLPLLKTRTRVRPLAPSSDLIGELTTPTVVNIQAANLRVSQRLLSNPESAEAHEDAALVLGIMALRESAGSFTDTRPLLSRITAHLTMARALGSGVGSKNRRAAELIVLTLINRQQDALDGFDAWQKEAQGDGVPHLLTALRLRVTGNWREVDHPETLSLLERIAYVHALGQRVGGEVVLEFLAGSHPEPVCDWTRAVASVRATVGTGNALARMAVDCELYEAAIVWPHAADDSLATLTQALTVSGADRDAAAAEPYRVIDWPLWRAASQRHLANDIAMVTAHAEWMIASRDAPQIRAQFERTWGAMPLYPLVRRVYADDRAEYDVALAGGQRLIAEHPELVTPANWTYLATRWQGAPVPDVPPSATWFTPLVPGGTAFDAANRIVGVANSLLVFPATLRELKTMAPFDQEVAWRLQKFALGEKPTVDRLEQFYGATVAYDVTSLRAVVRASWPDIDAWTRTGQQLCRLNADDCWWVADGLIDYGHPDEAAEVYRLFVADARDRVSVTTKFHWLMAYDLAHSRIDEARALADEGEQVYSGSGLLAKASFLEETGRVDEAEAVLQKAAARYPDTMNRRLLAFYLRQMTTPAARRMYEPVAQPLLMKAFPSGVELFDGGSADAPVDGVCLKKVGYLGEHAGVHVNDIIVAVNGMRVHNEAQMEVAKHAKRGDSFSAWVYRDGRYFEVKNLPRFGWASLELTSYRDTRIR